MTNQLPSPQQEERPAENNDLRKKLQKRERRVLERLQEAQEAQDKALERFRRAEARLQRRTARVQRVEGRLTLIRQQLEELNAPAPVEARFIAPSTPKEDATPVGARFIAPAIPGEESEINRAPTDFVEEARAAAEAAEENARLAAERAAGAAARLEQPGSGAHLAQELLQIEAEAAQADMIAQEAERAAREAERRATDAERQLEEMSAIPLAGEEEEPERAELSPEMISEVSETVERGAVEESLFPSLEEAAQVAEIEAEEELMEAITAETIAAITAEHAAKAEALAEASSAHTREARRRAQQAEEALGEIRVAIRGNILTGKEAEIALQNAEREVTFAQAMLADAEAAEEQAVNAAMNAEAEAEVAEGMAYAATDRTGIVPLFQEEENDGETTIKTPVVRPQENS